MHHVDVIAAVEFLCIFTRREGTVADVLLVARRVRVAAPGDDYDTESSDHDCGCQVRPLSVIYANAFHLPTWYLEISGHVGMLVISSDLSMYTTKVLTYVDHLTLVMQSARIRAEHRVR